MSRTGWYVCNSVAAPFAPARVEIYSEIGRGGIDASYLLNELRNAAEVELRLNSPGGDVFEAIAIYNRLRGLDRVQVVVDGLAASAASVVAMAASAGCLAMAPHSRMMIHEAHLSADGMSSADLTAAAALTDGLSEEIAAIYARRSRRPASYWRDRMKAETWMSAPEAVGEGLADYVESADPVKAAMRWQVAAMVHDTVRERFGG